MNTSILRQVLVSLGLANLASGWICSCCCILCICARSMLDPVQILRGEAGDPLMISKPARLARSQQTLSNANTLEAADFLAICDADESRALSSDEFDGCLQNVAQDQDDTFGMLDTDADEKLSLPELKRFGVSIQGSGDCYQDLATGCAAQFVMYEKIRGVNRKSLCGGLQLYYNCVQKAAANCDDPRTKRLQGVFSWTQKQLEGTCNPGHTSPESFSQHATIRCSATLIRTLHSPQRPCAAMATFSECLQTKAGAKKGEELFEDVPQLAGCDRK